MSTKNIGYKLYFITWLLLLIITLLSIGTDYLSIPKFMKYTLLILLMLSKATFISMNFMHLRYESKNLIFTVVAGIILTSIVLFLLIMVDAITASKVNVS
jgi:caa(3)-type oxidase subunit IV